MIRIYNFFDVEAVGVRWDHGKQLVTDVWRFESHLQSLGCRSCWRHSQNHNIAFKFVKICLNANFKFHCSIHLLMFFWYKSFSSPRLPSGCACHLAVLATDLEVYSARQRLIWIEGPVGGILATETRPFFNATWFFSSKLVTRIFVKDPDLGSALWMDRSHGTGKTGLSGEG